jgi:epoxyqueuosine reductase
MLGLPLAMQLRHEFVAATAVPLGFRLAGCTPLNVLERGPYLEAWVAQGRAGEMEYLARRIPERIDPRLAHPWARSIIVLTAPYRPAPPPPGDWRVALRGRVAAYAAGRDYHHQVLDRLRQLVRRLKAAIPGARFRPYVDTGPLLEREWAARAGLGWIGKNTLFLARGAGSTFFLAELLTDVEVEPTAPGPDHCGTCTRCLAACPTGALEPGGYTMDPRLCLSYLTIEHRSAVPRALRPAIENWIFGCDLCQDVCPWNQDTHDPDAAEFLAPPLLPILALDEPAFRARFGRTAVTRTKRRGLLRNVAVALGNSGNRDAVPALIGALQDPEPLVRGHAAWALGRLGGPAARSALERARRRELEAEPAVEIDQALEALP